MPAPDLLSAGVSAPESDPSSLLSSLGRMTPVQGAGSMLAGFAAGAQGQPNPVLQQQMQAQRDQIALAGVMNQMQRERRLENESQRQVGLDLLKLDNEDARKTGAEIIASQLGPALAKTGQKLPPNFVQSLAEPTLNLDKRKQAYVSILAGADDDYLERVLKVPPRFHQALRMEAQSDPIQKMLLGKTRQEQEAEVTKEKLAVAKDQRDELKTRIAAAKEQRMDEEGKRKLDQMDRRLDIMEKQLDLGYARLQLQLAKPNEKKERREKTLKVMSLALVQMEELATRMDAKGYLPRGKDILSSGKASTVRLAFPNDEDWQAWRQLQASLIGFDRTVLNDIGARAFAAFKNQYALFDNPPRLEDIKRVTAQMRSQLETERGVTTPLKETIILRKGNEYREFEYESGRDTLPPDVEIIGVK